MLYLLYKDNVTLLQSGGTLRFFFGKDVIAFMNRYRKHLLFLCDSCILVTEAFLLSQFALRYGLTDAVGQGTFWPHMGLLFGHIKKSLPGKKIHDIILHSRFSFNNK